MLALDFSLSNYPDDVVSTDAQSYTNTRYLAHNVAHCLPCFERLVASTQYR